MMRTAPSLIRTATGALALLVWLLPGGLAHQFGGGVPFTGMAVFAALGVWWLLWVTLPWRSDRFGLGVGMLLILVGLLAAKWATRDLAVPHGLRGTYEPLVGRDLNALIGPAPPTPDGLAAYLDAAFDAQRVPVAGNPGRPWSRLDPDLAFEANRPVVLGNDFHLLFYNLPPTTLWPKPHVRLRVEPPESACAHLDFAAVRVTWKGWLALPRGASVELVPQAVGYWSITLAGRCVSRGGPMANGTAGDGSTGGGGPHTPAMPTHTLTVTASGDGAPQPIEIRYLRPVMPADTPRSQLHTRFVLRWSVGGQSPRAVPSRWLYPPDDVMADMPPGDPYASFAEGLHALAVVGLMIVTGVVAVWGIDWLALWRRAAHRRRLLVTALAAMSFVIAAAETFRHSRRDAQYNTPDAYDYKLYLMRALALSTQGGPTPQSARREGQARSEWDFLGLPGDKPIPPPQATEFTPPDPHAVVYHSWPAVDAIVRRMAVALQGRLGPVVYYQDEPATLPNRLFQHHRNPLMDHYLAGLLWLTAERLGVCYLFQGLMCAVAVGLTAHLARRIFGPRAGVIAAATLACDLQFTKFVALFFAETPAALLTVAALAALVEARYRDRAVGVWPALQTGAWYALSGAILGLAFLMRPNLALLWPTAMVWLAVGRPWPTTWYALAGWLAGRAARAIAVSLPFALLWCLVPIRNAQLCGQPLWSATSGPTVLIIGADIPLDWPLDGYHAANPDVAPAVMAGWLEQVRLCCFDYSSPDRPRPAIGDPLHPAAYPQVNPVLMRLYADFAASHPGHIVRVTLAKLWRLWGIGTKWTQPDRWQPLLYLAVLVAAMALLPWRWPWCDSMCDPGGRAAAQWLVLAVIAAVSVPLVVFYFEDRHRLPYLPMVHILGAGVIANCITVYGARRQQAGPQTRALDNLSRTSE